MTDSSPHLYLKSDDLKKLADKLFKVPQYDLAIGRHYYGYVDGCRIYSLDDKL